MFGDGETRRGVGWGRGALLGSDAKRHRGRSLGVAGGAISRTSKHGPWSRFGEEAGDFRFAFWGPQCPGDPQRTVPGMESLSDLGSSCRLWAQVCTWWASFLIHGGWSVGVLVRQQAVSCL